MSRNDRPSSARPGAGIDAGTAARAAVAGAGAFVASYLVSFLLWTFVELPEPETFGEAARQFFVELFRESIPAWKGAGLLLYNGHFLEVASRGGLVESSFSLVELADGSLIVLYVVPPVALLVAGYATASAANVRDTAQSAIAGALVTLGYLALVVLGTFLFAVNEDGSTLSVSLPNAVVLAGIIYPVVFGAIGGVVADVV